MTKTTISNGFLFVTLMVIPLIAEFITAKPNHVPGIGFDVLLYQPFDFAYMLLAGVLFIAVNLHTSKQGNNKVFTVIGKSVAIWLFWFLVSFLAVGQLHLSLGGKL